MDGSQSKIFGFKTARRSAHLPLSYSRLFHATKRSATFRYSMAEFSCDEVSDSLSAARIVPGLLLFAVCVQLTASHWYDEIILAILKLICTDSVCDQC